MTESEDIPTKINETLPSHTVPEAKQVDYFGDVGESERHMLPDNVSFVQIKMMNEGDRRKYLADANSGLRIAKDTGDSHLALDPGGQRFHLLKVAITDWNLVNASGAVVRFGAHELGKFLKAAPPAVIDDIEKAVNDLNPWLSDNLTVEGIDEEMDRLAELREEIVARDEGKES